MRTDVKVATLSLAVFLGACNARQEQATGLSEDLKKDLAVASSSASDLATAPKSYQRARFVSDVEMSRVKTPAPRPVKAKRRTAPVRRPEAVSRPASDVVEEPTVASNEELAPAPAAVAVATSSTPEPVVINQQPTEETAPAPVPVSTGRGDDGRSVGEGGIGDRSTGRGIGGLLGGIIGAVVIRGGHGGVDKCDPRTDGRRGGIMTQRPDFGMPSPVGRPTFPSM
jgi:hypothetical protein